jgi:predicted small secreted protein
MRRTASVLITTIALSLTLTSCGAGQDAATRNIKQVTDGVEKTIDIDGNKIKIVNALLVATEDGSAVVVGTVINQGEVDDQILTISAAGAQATLSGDLIAKPNQPIRFEGDAASAKAVFPGVGAVAGRHVKLNIGFARAGLVELEVIIRDKRDTYANVTAG